MTFLPRQDVLNIRLVMQQECIQQLSEFITNLQSRNDLEILLQYSADSDIALLTGRVPGQLGWAQLSSLFFSDICRRTANRNLPV
jgi:hypothetical protein